jgi:hypothetical protein
MEKETAVFHNLVKKVDELITAYEKEIRQKSNTDNPFIKTIDIFKDVDEKIIIEVASVFEKKGFIITYMDCIILIEAFC